MGRLLLAQVCLLILASCGKPAPAAKPSASSQSPAATQAPASAKDAAAASQAGRSGQLESRRYPYSKDIRADTLIIDNDGEITVLGQHEFMEAAGTGRRFTGIPGKGFLIPTGEVKVWVFRRIGDSYKTSLESQHIDVREGAAYIVEYDKEPVATLAALAEHLRVFTYIGDFDVQLNDQQLAAKFRVAP